jgi:hypothetical protein
MTIMAYWVNQEFVGHVEIGKNCFQCRGHARRSEKALGWCILEEKLETTKNESTGRKTDMVSGV